jgi:uncharacterized protein
MTTAPNVTELDRRSCWDLLAGGGTGRLALCIDGRPKIFPVTYAVNRGSIVFRTGTGTKLGSARGSAVAFEADGVNSGTQEAWSVVVEGRAEEVQTPQELAFLTELPLYPVSPGPKLHFVRIDPQEITGRRFQVVAAASGSSTN